MLKNLSSHGKLLINNLEKRRISMKQLINIISNYIFKREAIPDEYLYEFCKEITSAIELSDTECIPNEFWQLANYVELYWRGQKYSYDDNPERIYQMGQLLSFTKMISIWFDRIEKNTSLNEYALIMNNKYSFFKSIHDEPGITHKKLASKMHTSISSLSQFVNKIQGIGFFISRPMGREKHYYLTQKGEKIYELITKNQSTPVPKSLKQEYLVQYSNQNKQFNYSYLYKLYNHTSNINIEVGIEFIENTDIKKIIISNHKSEVRKWSKNNLLKQKVFSC